jgi:DmsE family decaheme c-type cytochrome
MANRLSSAICFTTSFIFLFFIFLPDRDSLAQADPQQECLRCHPDQAGILETKHGVEGDPGSPVGRNQACSACHGLNPNHASDPAKNPHPVRFERGSVPAKQQTQACMSCHAGNRHLAFWETGRHARNDVRCNDCHAVHAKPPRGSTIAITRRELTTSPFVATERQLEYETCIGCHKQVRVQINKPSHHPIIEGKVTCSSCHNPHGAMSQGMVKQETVNVQCWSCHAEKRGPFLFQHPAVEENCLSCHAPHGSSHAKLLNEKVPNLCQDCHDWSRHPGTAYSGDQGFNPIPGGATTPNTRFVARACLNCHNAIHGSNAPATRGKFLTR